jgi:hypothetical protein
MGRRRFPAAARHARSVRFKSVREDRVVVVEGARELRAAEPRVGQVGAVEARDASRKDAVEARAGKIRADQPRTAKVGAAEII